MAATAAQVAKTMLGGAHTAGIYADMTVDGPEIGTLVVIVDRAKNLPNRKTMGKQDPYCAARLGKEAKKTETDRRGGQTPKWDQEMRFTVYDSPDYYRLKVSVFNDDKKTEIIGETWVALESIIVPGGGQNDIWHNLNCKGRYAGEIRIELTYYDTRPREVKTEERRQSSQVNGLSDPGREGISGPRQPKPMKRRPLPADPTDSTRSSPLPKASPANYSSLSATQQRYVESPDDFAFEATPTLDSRVHRIQNVSSRGPPLNQNSYSQGIYSGDFDMLRRDQYVEPINFDRYGVGPSSFSQSPQNGHSGNQNPTYDPDDDTVEYAPAHDSNFKGYSNSFAEPTVNNSPPKSLVQPFRQRKTHSNSSPAIVELSPRHRSPLSKSNSYDDYPTHQRSHEDLDDGLYMNDQRASPPPPPTHRHSGSTSSPRTNGRGSFDHYSPIPAPVPLNLRNDYGSISGSPLSQAHNNTEYPLSASPSDSLLRLHPAASNSSTILHGQSARRGSQSPVKDYDQPMPPSLVPGYEPSIAADESERIVREQRRSAQQTYPDPSMPRHQQTAGYTQQARAQPMPRNLDHISERRAHRSSAPIINPRTVSPGPRTPMRKSVSPQPGSVPSERPQSELPFSPDSYEAFNPSLSASSSVNQLGARYNTPEQAKEATRQHERDISLGDGPIIGSDGRIIDPSDHLPTATWAPEPEQRSPRKGPEVTLRFKHTPQAAQPTSSSPRRPLAEARPNSVSSPIYAHSEDGMPPTATPRARLQKKARAGLGQPTSSPLVPAINTSPRNTLPRSSASDSPLREHENYGYNSSPTYVNRSPGAMPPPIPGKVPIGSGQEDWGMSALSEEMKRIDIGVGGGQRPRRSRYGP